MYEKLKMPLVGALTAILSIFLVWQGNPGNMGICTACFLRDIAGSLGLHTAAIVQYARPEIIGFILGAFFLSLYKKDYRATGGSAPVTRFVLGACVMIGALIFLGCPVRMWLRMAGGDLNAVVGLCGFIVGALIGIFFLRMGFTLKKSHNITKADGYTLPVISIILLVLVFMGLMLNFTAEGTGPGGMRAPVIWALIAGLIMGGFGYLYKFCFISGVRDSIMFKKFAGLGAFITLLIVGIIGNLIVGKFNLGFEGQPIAHNNHLWNFLGLTLVGFGAILLGGCPFRQIILAGSGNSDSTFAVFGMIFGAALAHNFKLASSGAGPGANGPTAFYVSAIIMLIIAVYYTFFTKKDAANEGS